MKRLLVLVMFIACATMVFATGAKESTVPEVSAGHGETELVVYSTIFAEYAEAMKAGFEALHPGVTVNVLNPGGTEAMFKKVESEAANPQADVEIGRASCRERV